MSIISLTFLFAALSVLLWQVNVITGKGTQVVETITTYVSDSAKGGWKYSLSFIPDSHESKLDKLKKHKEEEDLNRKIRIENIENELKETSAVLDKGMPNYYNLLFMFGESTIGQYELACQIVLMKDTLFVSESLSTLSQTIKLRIGEQLENMKMKNIVDKMIQHNIFTEIQTSVYIQQEKLLNNNEDKQQELMVLKEAFDTYHATWTLGVANEIMGAVKHNGQNLTHIQPQIITYNVNYNDNDLHLYSRKRNDKILYHSNHDTVFSVQNDDPKCITQTTQVRDWDSYNKY